MIAGLIGKIHARGENKVLFNVSGVLYEVFMSLNSLAQIKDECTIYTTQIVREDSLSLFGFVSAEEKNLFENLIKLNGIGPKVAISICSCFSASEFGSIIANNDFTSLKKVPGIGEKMAKRIIVELSGKLESLSVSQNLPNHKNDALSALEGLGFKNNEIRKFLESAKGESVQDLIKEFLQSIKG